VNVISDAPVDVLDARTIASPPNRAPVFAPASAVIREIDPVAVPLSENLTDVAVPDVFWKRTVPAGGLCSGRNRRRAFSPRLVILRTCCSAVAVAVVSVPTFMFAVFAVVTINRPLRALIHSDDVKTPVAEWTR
jgi:hypothetical protein